MITKQDILIGDIYKEPIINSYTYVATTANSCISKTGRLVMGRGNAKIVRDMFKDIDLYFAKQIKHLDAYGILVNEEHNIIALQTKRHWFYNSPIKLVEFSCDKLLEFVNNNPDITVATPVPGISNGKLPLEEVLKILPNHPRIDWYMI